MPIFSYSKTANSNTSMGGVTAAEGMSPAAVNNLARAVGADLKKWQEDMGAAVTTGGSANTYTLTTNSILTALEDGQELGFVASATNTGASTLAVDGLSAKAIRRDGDIALVAGNIVVGGHYGVSYDASANSAAGAWMLRNPSLVIDIAGTTELTDPDVLDEMLVNDVSVPVNRKITLASVMKVIADLPAETLPASDDLLALIDISSANAANKITTKNFFNVINEFDEHGEPPDNATDYLVFYDASAVTPPKKLLTKWIGAGTQPLWFPYQLMKPTLSGPAIAYDSTTTDISGYRFITGAVRSVHVRHFMPNAWNNGTVTFKFFWAPHDTVGTGNVVWGVQAKAISTSDDLEASFGSAVTATASGVQGDTDLVITAETNAVTVGGTPANGDVVIFRFYRDGTNGSDTYNANAILLGVRMAYTTSSNTED